MSELLHRFWDATRRHPHHRDRQDGLRRHCVLSRVAPEGHQNGCPSLLWCIAAGVSCRDAKAPGASRHAVRTGLISWRGRADRRPAPLPSRGQVPHASRQHSALSCRQTGPACATRVARWVGRIPYIARSIQVERDEFLERQARSAMTSSLAAGLYREFCTDR